MAKRRSIVNSDGDAMENLAADHFVSVKVYVTLNSVENAFDVVSMAL